MRLLIKRKVFIASCVLIISLFCTSCSGLGDWEITGLPVGYEIWRINSRSVILCKPDSQYDFLAATVVPAYVFEIAYTDAYIFAKRADVPEDLDEPISYSDPDYYIVDTDEGACFGPYDEEMFYETMSSLNISDTPNWMDLQTLRRKQ